MRSSPREAVPAMVVAMIVLGVVVVGVTAALTTTWEPEAGESPKRVGRAGITPIYRRSTSMDPQSSGTFGWAGSSDGGWIGGEGGGGHHGGSCGSGDGGSGGGDSGGGC